VVSNPPCPDDLKTKPQLVRSSLKTPKPAAVAAFGFARAFSYDVMHTYAFRMAEVFMITTSTLAIRSRVTTPWIAWPGYASALLIWIGSGFPIGCCLSSRAGSFW
jgi:hypothetical protein